LKKKIALQNLEKATAAHERRVQTPGLHPKTQKLEASSTA